MDFPENNQRSLHWFNPIEASNRVEEKEFSEILLEIEGKLTNSHKKIKTKKAS
jgi:hypothetical protein